MQRLAQLLMRLWRRARRAVPPVTEVGFKGASLKLMTRGEKRKLASELVILTPRDCALVLDMDEDKVTELLDCGLLPGLLIGRHWRIQAEDLARFVQLRKRETSLARLRAALDDPAAWAAMLWEDPERAERILADEYDEGTVGRFWQDALRDHPPAGDE